jgi:glycosyltransferase involved in cell wall biosynthesis
MVTKDRASLARRALRCLAQQTWPNKELVVIDDGAEDYSSVLEPYKRLFPIRYCKIAPDPSSYLGALRNISLERAEGDYLVQWDDDEWYHPDRIARQAAALNQGADVVVLRDTLYHLDSPRYVEHLFHTRLPTGATPGTIMQRRSPVRYPNLRRAEDTVYLEELTRTSRLRVLDDPHSHLFIRCFHGANTWDLRHFEGALQHGSHDKLWYWLSKHLFRDLTRHPAFRLTDLEQRAAQSFLEDSRALGLLQHAA